MNQRLLKQYVRKMPAGSTPKDAENEIVDIIQSVAKALSRIPRFRFGYHSRADIEQQGVLIALEILEEDKYDPSRPLEGFLYTHLKRRLGNYKRDNYIRAERPCQCCNPFDPPVSPCERFDAWQIRNTTKQNLMLPLDVSSVADEYESNMRTESMVEEEAHINELLTMIDEQLPVELRADYLKMTHGVAVPKNRRLKVREAVMEIIKDGEEEDIC